VHGPNGAASGALDHRRDRAAGPRNGNATLGSVPYQAIELSRYACSGPIQPRIGAPRSCARSFGSATRPVGHRTAAAKQPAASRRVDDRADDADRFHAGLHETSAIPIITVRCNRTVPIRSDQPAGTILDVVTIAASSALWR
jgi:hypothetical protein